MLTELITPADPAADSPADSAALAPVFDALLGELTQLSRNHLLYFRVQVGRSVADALYSGDPAAYHHQASNKDSSLRRFAAHRRDQLADLGLTEATLRQCVRAWFVARDLPDGTLERLVLSHLNLLSQVDDAASPPARPGHPRQRLDRPGAARRHPRRPGRPVARRRPRRPRPSAAGARAHSRRPPPAARARGQPLRAQRG